MTELWWFWEIKQTYLIVIKVSLIEASIVVVPTILYDRPFLFSELYVLAMQIQML